MSTFIDNWDDLNLCEDILRGIYSYGFEKPTPIQRQSILPIIQKKDVIAQAQSGTGKTGSFTIGTLQNVDFNENTTQALLLLPTHELVKQVYNVFLNIGSTISNMRIKVLQGGTSIQEDINYFKKQQPHIVIGTTGRTYDMIQRKILCMDHVKMLILDEADEMLSNDFREIVQKIYSHLLTTSQIILFSATLPNEILDLTRKFMIDPVKITIEPEKLSLECIQQYYIAIQEDKDKYEVLKDLFSILQLNQSIIYVSSIQRVNLLYNAMIEDKYPVICIHSEMSKHEREDAMRKFRSGEFRVLISSNITSRGIDVQQVSTVINFDVFRNIDTYLHAIGRSGRYGRKGLAINFVTRKDVYTMKRIEKHYNIKIKELPGNIESLL